MHHHARFYRSALTTWLVAACLLDGGGCVVAVVARCHGAHVLLRAFFLLLLK